MTEEFDPMEVLVERDKALADMDKALAERDFARKQYSELFKQLERERELFGKEIRRANEKSIQNIRFPFVVILAFAGLALLVGMLVKCELIPLLLGEQLGYVCIYFCAFFGGMVWSKTESRIKKNQQ